MNDNEFRFIKCPGCRGLVPATATKCRMCGQELTAHDSDHAPQQREEHKRDRSNTVDWGTGETMAGKKADSDPTVGRSGSIYDFLKKDFDEIDHAEDDYPIEADPYGIDDYENATIVTNDVVKRDVENRPVTRTTGTTELSEAEEKIKRQFKTHSDTIHSYSKSTLESGRQEYISEQPIQKKQVELAVTDAEVLENVKPATKPVAEPVKEPVRESVKESYRTEDKMINEQKNNSQIHIKSSNQQLIGWLLSFKKDSCGSAVEIREGRFFVSSSKVRETDLVISDGSLSVPHCLMKADRGTGIQVQDLMSENGTYIRKEHSGEYEIVTSPTVAEHGDWLKFGDYEVMVCVVPSEGRHITVKK